MLPPHAHHIAAPLAGVKPSANASRSRLPIGCTASNCAICSSVQVWKPSPVMRRSLMPSVGSFSISSRLMACPVSARMAASQFFAVVGSIGSSISRRNFVGIAAIILSPCSRPNRSNTARRTACELAASALNSGEP